MSLYKYSQDEIKQLLNSIVILVDTREQKNQHILKYFDSKGIKYKSYKLNYGDYSFYLPKCEELGILRDTYFTDKINIERKANLEELSGNFSKDRTRIENEFLRHRGTLYLLIENSTYGNLIKGKYQTKYKPLAFLASLNSMECKYNFKITFLEDKALSGNFIYYKFYYFLMNYLRY